MHAMNKVLIVDSTMSSEGADSTNIDGKKDVDTDSDTPRSNILIKVASVSKSDPKSASERASEMSSVTKAYSHRSDLVTYTCECEDKDEVV